MTVLGATSPRSDGGSTFPEMGDTVVAVAEALAVVVVVVVVGSRIEDGVAIFAGAVLDAGCCCGSAVGSFPVMAAI